MDCRRQEALDVILDYALEHVKCMDNMLYYAEIVAQLSVDSTSLEYAWKIISKMGCRIPRLIFHQTIPYSKMELRAIDMLHLSPAFVKNAHLEIQDLVCHTLINDDSTSDSSLSWHLMYYIDPKVRKRYIPDLTFALDEIDTPIKYCALHGIEMDYLDTSYECKMMWAPIALQQKHVKEMLEQLEKIAPMFYCDDCIDYIYFPRLALHPDAWSDDIVGPYKPFLEKAARKILTPDLLKILGFVAIESLEDIYLSHMFDFVPEAFAAMAALSTETVLRHLDLFEEALEDEDCKYAACLVVNHLADDHPLFDHIVVMLSEDIDSWYLTRLQSRVLDCMGLPTAWLRQQTNHAYLYQLDIKYVVQFIDNFLDDHELQDDEHLRLSDIVIYDLFILYMPPHIYEELGRVGSLKVRNLLKCLPIFKYTIDETRIDYITVTTILRLGYARAFETFSELQRILPHMEVIGEGLSILKNAV